MSAISILVFGTDRAGRNRGSAAVFAVQERGAMVGVGEGPSGRAYAIPTRSETLELLPIAEIRRSVSRFLEFAAARPDTLFEVTAIGCERDGHAPRSIAPLFADAPLNVRLPRVFVEILSTPIPAT